MLEQLNEILLSRHYVSQKQLNFAQHESHVTNKPIGEVLEKLGMLTRKQVAELTAELVGLEYIDSDKILPSLAALKLFNFNFCSRNNFIPIAIDGNEIVLASSEKNENIVREAVSKQSHLKVKQFYSDAKGIQKTLYHYYFSLDNPIEDVISREVNNVLQDENAVRTLDDLLSHIIHLAVKKRCTDIHVRPMDTSINVAFRIDGVMHSMFSLDKRLHRLTATIKLRSSMDIAEFRLPQDGAFDVKLNEDVFDIRVSTIICSEGENVVMRLLPRNHEAKVLRDLGYEEEHLSIINRIFKHPAGIFLITGPTGSGKTTTLHAGLRNVDLLDKNVLTVEDPIEYRIPLVRQTQVNNAAGYTFSSAIRHFLRHDPDVILVGEIRDAETAKTAITAAETGHLVLSTLHTNNVMGIVPRLLSLGVPLHMITDSLVGCISQRLIRRVCGSCAEMVKPTAEDMEYLDIDENRLLRKGKGCEHCSDTGFIGRDTLYEILPVNPDFLAAYETNSTVVEIQEKALAAGMVTAYEVAKKKVLAGNTSVSEVIYLAPKPE